LKRWATKESGDWDIGRSEKLEGLLRINADGRGSGKIRKTSPLMNTDDTDREKQNLFAADER
jgi:hypothetical protein